MSKPIYRTCPECGKWMQLDAERLFPPHQARRTDTGAIIECPGARTQPTDLPVRSVSPVFRGGAPGMGRRS